MLAVTCYTKDYVSACRARVESQVSAFKTLVAASAGAATMAATSALEPIYFTNALLALDGHFVHRLRGAEGKDGNPLNEVRMLCNALLANGGVLAADKTIKYVPAKSVLQYEIGQPVQLSSQAFALLAEAFLGELERRYG